MEEEIHSEPDNLRISHSSSENRYKSMWKILHVVLCYNLGSIYLGYTLVYFNAIKYEKIHKIFSIDMDEGVGEGLFSGLIQFGAIFGAVASKFILKFCTRKQSFFMANIIAFIAGLMVLVQSMKTLLIGRILQGASVGIFSSIVPLTIREYVPVEISGFMGSFFAPSIVLGTFLGYLFPYILSFFSSPNNYWSYSFGFTLAIIALQVFLLLTVFKAQTPKYLLRIGKLEEAKELIAEIYEEQYCEQVLKEKLGELKITKIKGSKSFNQEASKKSSSLRKQNKPGVEVEMQMEEGEGEREDGNKGVDQEGEEKSEKSNVKERQKTDDELNESQQEGLFWDEDTKAKYPKDIPKAVFLAFWMELFQNLAGVYVVTLYGRQIADFAMPDLERILPVLLNMWRLFMSIVAINLIKKYGRKKILIPGVLVMSLGLLGLFIGFLNLKKDDKDIEWFLFFCLLVMITSFTISIAPITWLYIPEIVQPPMIPFTTIMNWISAYLIVFLFPYIQEKSINKTTPWLFFFFFICMVVHTVVLRIVMRETRYKNESEIRVCYREPLSNACRRRWHE